jgi:hypothetical protein
MQAPKLILGSEIDVDAWDHTVRKDPYGHMYGLSWYLDMVAPEWHGLVMGDYNQVMPLPVYKKFGIPYIARPYGAQQLGIFSRDPIGVADVENFLEAIPKKYRWVDIYMNQHNPLCALDGFKVEPQTNIELSLECKYEELIQGYSSQTRRNLKKGKQHKLQIFEHDSPDVLIGLFKRNKGKDLPGMKQEQYDKIRHIMYVLLHKRRGYLWTVYDEGNALCAGAYFAEIHGRIVLLFSATDAFGRKSGAMTFLFDELFKVRCGSNCIFDFEGSSIPGLKEFYLGFGGVALQYQRMVRNNLPFPLNLFKK